MTLDENRTARNPLSDPRSYVQEHRKDLLHLLRCGEPYVRGLALHVLLEGAEPADWDLVEREVQLARELDDETLEEIYS